MYDKEYIETEETYEYQITVPGGILKTFYDINDEKQVDYSGNSKILIIPACFEEEILPTEAFSTCTTIEWIIDLRGCSFEYFTFMRCENLAGIISIRKVEQTDDYGTIYGRGSSFGEYAFTDDKYIPRQVPKFYLFVDHDENGEDELGHLVSVRSYETQNEEADRFLNKLTEFAENNDVDSFLKFTKILETTGKPHGQRLHWRNEYGEMLLNSPGYWEIKGSPYGNI